MANNILFQNGSLQLGGTNFGSPYVSSASATLQDLTYTAMIPGPLGNAMSVVYFDGATEGSEVALLNGLQISVQIQSGVSTAQDIYNAVNGLSPLITVAISGVSSNPQVIASAALTNGDTDKSAYNSWLNGPVTIQYTNPAGFVTMQDITYYIAVPTDNNGTPESNPLSQTATIAYAATGNPGTGIYVNILGNFSIQITFDESAVASAQNILDAILAYPQANGYYFSPIQFITPVITGNPSNIQTYPQTGTTSISDSGVALSMVSASISGTGLKFTNIGTGQFLDINGTPISTSVLTGTLTLQNVSNITDDGTDGAVFVFDQPISARNGVNTFAGNLTFSSIDGNGSPLSLNADNISAGSLVMYDNSTINGEFSPAGMSGPAIDFGNRLLWDASFGGPFGSPAAGNYISVDWNNHLLYSSGTNGNNIIADFGITNYGDTPGVWPSGGVFTAIKNFAIAGDFNFTGSGSNIGQFNNTLARSAVIFSVSGLTNTYLLNLPTDLPTNPGGQVPNAFFMTDTSGNVSFTNMLSQDLVFSATNTYNIGSVLFTPAPVNVTISNAPGPNSYIYTFTPVLTGAANNDITVTVQYQPFNPPPPPAAITVTGHTINVFMARDGSTTGAAFRSLWNSTSAATALLTLSVTGDDSVFNPLPPHWRTNPVTFSGGVDQNSPAFVYANAYAVGNTTSASTPGTVIAKEPRYDLTGALIGYIPIYNSIT